LKNSTSGEVVFIFVFLYLAIAGVVFVLGHVCLLQCLFWCWNVAMLCCLLPLQQLQETVAVIVIKLSG